ncbi:NUDIX hydrolase [Orenia marismortui]|uniref:NUDIX domain-containing protein n=1 Tax=Orenia marismortui TaxID=46469 RepID=A0A4R8H0L9_9FIRM|nr:CoA pyrophosphatase [Orenia marismortui]TDX52927.1 NUDIX domain-containing protein [Orenia marismortui]
MKDQLLRKIKNQLPKFPGIQGKDRYFNSAVLILLIYIDGEYHFLFQKRAADIRQGGEICFPGGRYEPDIDNSYEETAIRESVEELGVEKEKIEIIGQLDTLVAAMGATVDSFIGILKVDDLEQLNINLAEVEKVFTVPIAYFRDKIAEEYQVRLEVQPSYINQAGEEIKLFPAEELGLPERYRKPWGGRKHKLYLYDTPEGIIWGITAELIREVVNLID